MGFVPNPTPYNKHPFLPFLLPPPRIQSLVNSYSAQISPPRCELSVSSWNRFLGQGRGTAEMHTSAAWWGEGITSLDWNPKAKSVMNSISTSRLSVQARWTLFRFEQKLRAFISVNTQVWLSDGIVKYNGRFRRPLKEDCLGNLADFYISWERERQRWFERKWIELILKKILKILCTEIFKKNALENSVERVIMIKIKFYLFTYHFKNFFMNPKFQKKTFFGWDIVNYIFLFFFN